jgi:ribosomal-protein-alanine N-acetyltransferase
VLGYAGLLVPGPEADVQTIAVAPQAQGQGLGRILLDALIAAAGSRSATSLLLEVRANNEPAIGLYTRRGFERIAIRRRYYQPEDVDAWVMRLALVGNR